MISCLPFLVLFPIFLIIVDVDTHKFVYDSLLLGRVQGLERRDQVEKFLAPHLFRGHPTGISGLCCVYTMNVSLDLNNKRKVEREPGVGCFLNL